MLFYLGGGVPYISKQTHSETAIEEIRTQHIYYNKELKERNGTDCG